MSISIECPHCRTLNSTTNAVCVNCQKRIPPLNRKYWLRYRVNGKSKKECLGTVAYKQAVETERQRLVEIPKKTRESLCWSVVAEKYLVKLKAEKRNTMYIGDTQRYLRRFCDFVDNRPVENITATLVREFQTKLRGLNLSEASCDRHLQAGKAAWNYAVEDITNPFSRVKLFNPDNVTERFLSQEQRNRLLIESKKINRTLYEILVVTMSTGFRKSSVLNLRRSEVDFETGVISIRQKGNLSHTTVLNDSSRHILKGIPNNGTDYFWVNPETQKPYHRDWRRLWHRARRQAGIPDEFRWHDLRHDVGTSVYAATHDILAVQRFLGHRNSKTTQRYAHSNPKYLEQISQVLSALCPISVLDTEQDE